MFGKHHPYILIIKNNPSYQNKTSISTQK